MPASLRSPGKLSLALSAAIIVALFSRGQAQESNSDDVAVIDGTMWSLITGEGPVAWQEANAFCETLEAGGFTDWRLATLAELEALHDPEAEDSIKGPFELPDCCAWSSNDLVDVAAEPKGQLPPPGGAPDQYFWGFLFDGGISYYSNGRMTDGFAMCRR